MVDELTAWMEEQDYERAKAEYMEKLNEIRAEIEQIEIKGHIRDVECFNAGINTALDIIDKYRNEQKGERL